MRVKFLQSIAGNVSSTGSPDGIQYPQFYFPEGFVGVLVDVALAEAWVASGICELASPADECRPPKPEFAVAVSPEQAAKRGPGRPAKSTATPVSPAAQVKIPVEAETKGE